MNTESKVIPDSEIMKQLLEVLRYSALAFANELEYKSHSTIHHILNGRNKISEDLITRIINKFPEVHYWFLKNGQQPIILKDKPKNSETEPLRTKDGFDNPDYTLETFLTLKKIELILLKISAHLEK